MKIGLKCSLSPLQNRTDKELPREATSFLKAFSVVSPIIIYYVLSQFVILLFAYFMQWVSEQEGASLQVAEWFRANSTAVSGIVKGLSLVIGAMVVFPIFLKETPVIKMPPAHKKDIGILFFLGVSAALCVNILFALLHFTGSSQSYEQVANKQFAFPLWAGIVLYGVLSPLAEEIVFRGIVYNRLRRQYSLWVALIISSLLFGLYHGNVVQAVYGSLLGFLIVVMYEKYGSFFVPVILHAAANIGVYVVTSSPVLQEKCMNIGVMFALGCFFIVLLAKCLSKK